MQETRTTSCPHCAQSLEVACADPLDELECPKCGKSFELLRKFAEFDIERRMNFGGTSILYLALDRALKKKIVLKVLRSSEASCNPNSSLEFRREMELTRSLEHPNLIRVYGGGQIQGFDYIVMEPVEGLAINEIMARLQPASSSSESSSQQVERAAAENELNKQFFAERMPELVCLEVAAQAAAALGVAHAKNLVHGDIKPENIMITFEGVVKVLDFGLVQFANAEKFFTDEETFSVAGTPLYIPPERVRGEPEDFRSDLYSLGATLYHMLRGVPPFRAKNPADLAMMHANAPMIKFKGVAPWASDTACRIVEKSLKKTVSERYSSHAELMADLMLAKNLLLQSTGQKARDGKKVLKEFVEAFRAPKKQSWFWQKS